MAVYGSWEHLRVEQVAEHVALVVLDQPERRNAMSGPMTAAWGRAMAALREERDLRCVVVTGAGESFCSGGDFSWIVGEPGAGVDRLRDRMQAFYATWLSVRDLEVPTVAAVNGHAVGAGLAVALACDLRVVAEDARLSVPFTSLGLHPGMGTTWLLPEVAGPAVARDMLLAGRVVTGSEAVALGIAGRAVARGEVLDEAVAIAVRVAAAAPVATRLTKAALAGGGPPDLAAALRWEALAQPVTMTTEDLAEGIAAARERRAPRFTGR
ncbi:MAG TPA: enoyl-CoA hydratase/isomerase family protein [Jiangellales bacterium]|nr:enoyl-CoA hydratase/isomerase family protein [Jiangellales bacterium]